MNQPEYILSDVLREVTASTGDALTANDSVTFPNPLNYQHGYVEEMNETLIQWQSDPVKRPLKFPIVWFIDRVKEERGMLDYYSKVKDGQVFIINATSGEWKSDERDTKNYKPVILPIYREFLNQLFFHGALSFAGNVANPQGIKHDKIKAPYWGENQKSVITDKVDCLKIESLELNIKNNPNCS